MAKRFTRNIRSVENIEKQPKYTNEQNDLLSDDKEVYIRNQGKYEKITGNVEKVNNKEPDDSGNVEIDTGVMEVNDQTPDDSGNVEIDTGAMTVNDEKPDENGNVTIDTGTMTVNEEKPDDKGNVEIDTGVHKVNQETADDSGNVEIDTGVMQVNGKEPDEEGHILIEASDIPDNQNLARKEYVKKEISKSLSKFENEYLVMTDTFENAFPDRKKTRLQYVLQGNMMQIFGLIRTKKELTGKDTHVVAKIPDKFNPIIEGYNYGTMGARYHFKTYINEKNDPKYPNEITIRSITDVDNQYVDLSADEQGVFHISLTIGVEVNE